MKRPRLDSNPARLATIQKHRPESDPGLLTDEEKVKPLESMSAYAGTYTADGDKVVRHVDTSWNGPWTGTDQVRFYKLDGDILTTTTAGVSEARPQKETKGVEHAREYRN